MSKVPSFDHAPNGGEEGGSGGERSPGRVPQRAEAQPGSTPGYIRTVGLPVNEAGPFSGLEDTLSLERFGSYMASCRADRGEALALYAHNTFVSSSLYLPLQVLEVTLRNRFHHALSGRYGDWWFDQMGVITDIFQRQKVSEAQLDLVKDQSRSPRGG